MDDCTNRQWRNKSFEGVVIYNEYPKRFKGEMMRKQYLRIVIALIGFAGLGITAKAQAVDQTVVNIPFEFVVAGKTLPAGNYRVNRVSDTDSRILVLSSFENKVSAVLLPTEVANSLEDKPEVTFEQVGDQHLLSKIETADHSFTIPVSRSEILEAEAKSHGATAASDSASGSN
jgi:hypothetical protein